MKAALLISGYLRTIKLNLPNIKKFIINNFKSTDVYIHITKNESSEDKYLNPNDLDDIIKCIESELSPKILLEENNLIFSNNSKENCLYNTWFKFYKLNSIKKLNEELHGKYDIVIKIRPDVNLQFINFDCVLDKIHIPKNAVLDKTKLHSVNDPYLCDIIAYGSSELMDKYFDLYKNLNDLVKLHGFVSETVLFYYLNKNKLDYVEDNIEYEVVLSMCNVFAICGDSASGKTTLGNLLKKYFSNSILLECDRYHKWERHSENWKTYTHLNPDANFVSKMQEDVFNLKIGNSIFQVDYDHNTGKFKQPEKIENADNIIVCGLHSLYGDAGHIYNFSIYMDPDESLKTKWKLERDVKTRGYTEEKVFKQISDRKNDYKKYVSPQKDNSDIVVNFFEKEDMSLGLNILINKKHSVENILSSFSKYNIPYEFKTNEKFKIISFNRYVYCERWNFGIPEETYVKYYNYIFYIILNLKSQY